MKKLFLIILIFLCNAENIKAQNPCSGVFAGSVSNFLIKTFLLISLYLKFRFLIPTLEDVMNIMSVYFLLARSNNVHQTKYLMVVQEIALRVILVRVCLRLQHPVLLL